MFDHSLGQQCAARHSRGVLDSGRPATPRVTWSVECVSDLQRFCLGVTPS